MKFFSGKLTKPPCQLFCHWWILFLVLGCLDYGTATITLNSTLDGQPTSPGEVVNYTCTLTEAAFISWTAPPTAPPTNPVRFLHDDTQRMLGCSDFSAINCTDLDFRAALTSVVPTNMTGYADLTSTFRFTATVALNGTVVQCSGSTITGTEMVNQTLIVEAPTVTIAPTVTTSPTPTTVTTPTATPTSTGTRLYLPLWATVLAAVVALALAKVIVTSLHIQA